VVQIEEHNIGAGVPGALTRKIQQLFDQLTN
jgi:hypothetical protein